MVALSDIKDSNARIASELPAGLVAVFVGATSGIGETALKKFAQYAKKPRIYFVGRSQVAADRIKKECQTLNSEGEYIFLKEDVSLLNNIDGVCREIQKKERAINLLFLTQGTLNFTAKTSEGLLMVMALAYHSRLRFTLNLLPQLEQATGLRRVVTVMAAGHEGAVHLDKWDGQELGMLAARPHLVSLKTLAWEKIVQRAPSVSFVHDYPGFVQTNAGRDVTGVVATVARTVLKAITLFVGVPIDECGERHLFLATSGKYPPGSPHDSDKGAGVSLKGGSSFTAQIATGTNGKQGSGVYSIDDHCESTGPKVERILSKLRDASVPERAWEKTVEDFVRITGSERMVD